MIAVYSFVTLLFSGIRFNAAFAQDQPISLKGPRRATVVGQLTCQQHTIYQRDVALLKRGGQDRRDVCVDETEILTWREEMRIHTSNGPSCNT